MLINLSLLLSIITPLVDRPVDCLAFCRILCSAADEPALVHDGDHAYAVSAGDVILSLSRLADRLDVTKSAARAVLARLERAGAIAIKVCHPIGPTDDDRARRTLATLPKALFAVESATADRPENDRTTTEPVRASEPPTTAERPDSDRPNNEESLTSSLPPRTGEIPPDPTALRPSPNAVAVFTSRFPRVDPGRFFDFMIARFHQTRTPLSSDQSELDTRFLAWARREDQMQDFHHVQHDPVPATATATSTPPRTARSRAPGFDPVAEATKARSVLCRIFGDLSGSDDGTAADRARNCGPAHRVG